MRAVIVVTTVGNEEQAHLLAEELVGRRHAACVSILPVQRSVYRWENKVCDDSEYLLIVKTLEDEYPAIEAAIRELHEYDLPEILAFDVDRIEPRVLDWLSGALDKSAASDEADDTPID